MLRDPLPHPVPAAAPYVVIAVGVPVIADRGDLPTLPAQSMVIAAVIAGAAAMLVSWARRITICDRTDRWIAYGEGPLPDAEVERARRRELSSMRHRRMLAACFRRFQRPAARLPEVSAQVPADIRVAAACAGELNDLTRLLEDESRTIAARGIARAERLIREPTSPLYRSHPPRIREARCLLGSVLNDLERMD